jgi:SpoIID/LytB domain protein
MDLETAVASVVAGEQMPTTHGEALAAQAIAARSYYTAARGRHRGFDFCDTTHCQFLRAPAPAGSPAARATDETAGLVLAYRDEPIAALYSARCGGRTKTLAQTGLRAGGGYPYFSVECPRCADAPPFRGYGPGHGVGLCQTGAAALAEDGKSWRDIVAHYYPGTTVA